MPWNGSGSFSPTNGAFTGARIWQRVREALEKVRADRFDSFSDDIAGGLENCLTRTGETSPTADVPMGSNKVTGLADGVARSDAVNLGQLADRARTYVAGADVGGTANAITLTPTPAVTAYAINQAFRFVVKEENTAAVTVAISGLAGVAIQRLDASGTAQALAAGDLRVGAVVDLWHNGAVLLALNGLFTPDLRVLTEAEFGMIAVPDPTTVYFRLP